MLSGELVILADEVILMKLARCHVNDQVGAETNESDPVGCRPGGIL